MIEGGVAGGSALQQASQRRATADRLTAEAKWLEALAADERSMAMQLAMLPPAYALLHDLRLPGSKGNVDHLVVGPGGAFVVVIRRCSHTVEYRDGELWADSQPLSDVLAAAEVEAQLLTQVLRTPVVGVVALLDAVLPAAMPPKVAGVLVCTGDLIARVVTRGSHTLLPPHQVAEVSERALPLLHSNQSVPRTESSLGVQAEPGPDRSVVPMVPPHLPASEKSVQRRLATKQAAKKARRNAPTITTAPARMGAPAPSPSQAKEKSGRSRSIRFVAAALITMCLMAVGVGSLVSTIWGDDGSGASATPTTSTPVTAATARDTSLSASTSSDAPGVQPPIVAFAATCSVPGAGWQLTPIWPGDIPGLLRYEIELQNLDATWTKLPSIDSPLSAWKSLGGQVANAAYTMRITAVVGDDRLTSEPTIITAPPTDC